MEHRATETHQVGRISTPKSLLVCSAAASARYVINYCLPVLHDYFMAQQLDLFYIKLMSQKRDLLGSQFYEPTFEVTKTTQSLVAHIKSMKDFYWSDSVLCPPHYKSIRSLISKEIVKKLNSGELADDFEVVSPLCKFVIQLLFCYDVGDFATGTVEVPPSACRPLSLLLKCLGPFRVSFLDARSLEFALVSPYEALLANTPDLKKIFVRDIVMGERGMSLISQICSKTLIEMGIEREGHYFRRCNLFELFFKGRSQNDVFRAAFKQKPTDNEITFPNLKRMYICCSERTECFHVLRFAVRKFYTNLVINGIKESHSHGFCNMPCCEDVNDTFKLAVTRNFPLLVHARPALGICSVKFLNFDTFSDVKVLELSGSSSWFVRNRIETYLKSSFGPFSGLNLIIYPDAEQLDNEFGLPDGNDEVTQFLHPNFETGLPRERQGFSLLLPNVGKTLLILKVNVSLAVDLREGLHCLNLCPVLREFAIYFNVVNLTDISPLLTVDLNTLPELTKITFCGELYFDSVRVDRLLRKIIKAAPNVRYLTLSHGLAKDINLMSSDCFNGIETLHLKNVSINRRYADKLKGALQLCPDVEELVLENVNDASGGWLKRIEKVTALPIRYVPKCGFLKEI